MIIFYCLRFEIPTAWRPRFPYLYPPKDRVFQLYPQALGSIFIVSYGSQGYGGGIRIQSVPHRKYYVSATEPNRLMLLRERVAVYCANHTEHINTLCGQKAGFYMLGQVVHIATTGLYSFNDRDQVAHLYGMIAKIRLFLIFIIIFYVTVSETKYSKLNGSKHSLI
jgi:hypothetical protein